MNIRLLRIKLSNQGNANSIGSFEVPVLIEIDGTQVWHTLRARPQVLAGFNTTLISTSDALQNLFQRDQVTLHRICKLVGDELRGRNVRVPQQIAA